MRRVWAIVIIGALMVLQSIPNLKVFGFFPDLLMIFIIYYSFKVGTSQGIILGAIVGLVMDILSGSSVGTRSIAFATVALSVEFFKTIFIFEMLFTIPIVSLLGTFIKYLSLFAIFLVFRSISLGEWYIAMVVEGIINFIFGFPMMWLSNKITSLLHREYYLEV
ncbi:MAG: rod shape-determining protein MreD [Brevinematia bacterium]